MMKLKKKSIQKICQSKFNKEQQIKRTKITRVIFKIYKKFNRKQINKNTIAQFSIE